MTIVMYDSVTISEIPADPPAVAGYVDGHFANFDQMVRDFPRAHRLSIAVQAGTDAECLDCEPGDASIGEAPAWWHRQHDRGIERPCLYTSLSNCEPLVQLLAGAGITRSQYRLWSAHYTGIPHLCNAACGFGLLTTADATQWTDKALGRNLDESVCQITFFGPPPPPPKPPDPHHYAWFDSTDRHSGRRTFNEHETVVEYDKKRARWLKWPGRLRRLRDNMTILAGRIETVAEDQGVAGKPLLAPDHRGWRIKQLDRRAAGQRLV
jgi:hypothetical protein